MSPALRQTAWCVRRRGGRAALLLLAAVALLLRLPLAIDVVADFPRTAPAALAHHLADFSNYQRADETIGSWWVEEEDGNYSWWRYAAAFECGARCRGRALLQSHALHDAAPQHGAAARHTVHLSDRRCRTLPLLPWPTFCDESEIEMEVRPSGTGAGSRLLRRVRYSCGALSLLLGSCRPPAPHAPAASALAS
ncbi:uncharacterized protein LOC121732420 [Aricia agestis]|uniref:uncharacterized protein LOC121732420 n=1 Tax=Aricia agestis TaxID=91739 RepID=UPI001C208564|nr:uncharacterized protein LOC121732420 [Aricia agestis]XP_041978224.1 uncharacterized protein LOC121732420 [Aricia agestis]